MLRMGRHPGAGNLDKRSSIFSPPDPESRDAAGQQKGGARLVARVWHGITPLSGRELEQAQQIRANVTHLVQLRWRPAVKPEQWLMFDGRRLNIDFVRNLEERNVTLELLCTEVEGQGQGP